MEASSGDKNDFIFLKRTTHVELWKKATKGTAINLIKVLKVILVMINILYITIRGCFIFQAFHLRLVSVCMIFIVFGFTLIVFIVYELIVDIDIRREWEKQIPILEVLDDTASHKTIYW